MAIHANGPDKSPGRRPRVTRRASGRALAQRLRFESLLLELSAAFLRVRADGTEQLIQQWLGRLTRFIGVDQSVLWERSADGHKVYRQHAHSWPGYEHVGLTTSSAELPWLTDQYQLGNTVVWARVPDDIPQAAAAEREDALRTGVKSFLAIPIAAGSMLCVIAFASLRRQRRWPGALIQRLRLAGEIFAGAVVRRRVEASLQASESRNRTMLRALPDLMFVLSPEGVYLDHHNRDESELLMPPEQFLGRRVDEVLPADAAARFRAAAQQARESGEVVEVEYTVRIRGEPLEREARIAIRDDGAIVCIVRNMTERNRAIRKLRESEQRFRGAFEHSAIGIALVSPEGRWLQVNPALCQMLGYSEAELLTMNFQVLTHPDDLGRNLDDLRRALAGEIDHYEFEKRYLHKDGRTLPTLLTASAVRDAHGRVLHFVSQIQDLSERESAQMEIERLRGELAHSGRVALTGQLTASLAHELMQPIAAMHSNAEAGQRLIAAGNAASADMDAILQDIVASCTRAADVINNVRRLLQKRPRPRRSVDVNRLVKEVISVMRQELMLRHVRLITHLDAALPEVNGNPIELQQVILNLLLNGAEAISQCASTRSELVLSTSHREQAVEITVSDSGAGIDPANLRHIFEPFFTTKPEGMGMGLTISAAIVRAHGGRLWAENNVTGGVTLHTVLPASHDGRGFSELLTPAPPREESTKASQENPAESHER